MTGAELITAERKRQVEEEGFTADLDDEQLDEGDLAEAAICYAMNEEQRENSPNRMMSMFERFWPFNIIYWKPTPTDRIRELTKAGALIAAEIDRLQRQNKGVVL
jgi:hypothetical protein